MGDPVSALAAAGVVSSIIQIVDFSGKVIFETGKLMANSNDSLKENKEIELLARRQKELSQEVHKSAAWQQQLPSGARALHSRADEIGRNAGELLDLLEDLKVTETKSKTKRAYQSARQVARAVTKRSKIEQKQKQLHDLTSQLAITILQDIAEAQLEQQSKLRTTVEDGLRKVLERLDQKLPDRFGLGITSDESGVQGIIDSLLFSDVDTRQGAIFRTYDKTYEWVFSPERSALHTWLMTGENIFWICGKPGSGKSTLMKFLAQHPETSVLLKGWAGLTNQECIAASFFFWYLGTPMQKSTKGLLQSILLRLFEQGGADLVKVACPQRWEHRTSYKSRVSWTEDELLAAVQAIAHSESWINQGAVSTQKSRKMRFAFFIDGLDEFDGNHSMLVTALQDLTASGKVKICVSCRPWNVFVNAFQGTSAVLHLQDLTQDDIELYVRGKLTKAANDQRKQVLLKRQAPQAEDLIQTVVLKANGVFFWVYLVVESLIKGFTEGDSIAIMRQRVEELPGELIPYFRLVLERMDKVYRKITSTALHLLLESTRRVSWVPGRISFLDIWPLIERPEHYEDPGFAFKGDYIMCTTEDLCDMKKETAQLIRASCRDYLHMTGPIIVYEADAECRSDLAFLRHGRVDFLHRTVYDFISLEDIQALLFKDVPGHLRSASLDSWITVARAKFVPVSHAHDACQYINELASLLYTPSEKDLRSLWELEDLEEFYMEEHCPKSCCIHVKPLPQSCLNRYRVLLDHQRRKLSSKAFTKRLKALADSGSIRPFGTSRHQAFVQSAIIRYSLGLDTYGIPGERSDTDQGPLGLDRLDHELVRCLLQAGANPEAILIAFRRPTAMPTTMRNPLEMFLRHWLLAATTPAQNSEIWAVVKLLIASGARIPKTCRIPDVKGRRSMDASSVRFTLDCGLWSCGTETHDIASALTFVVPDDSRNEIGDVLLAGIFG